MSLRLKFGVMLALLALAVILALGGAWRLFVTMQREVREPFRSMSVILDALGDAKEAIEAQGAIVGALDDSAPRPGGVRAFHEPPSRPVRPADLDAFRARARAVAATFPTPGDEAEDEWRLRTGTTALRVLRERGARASALGETYLADALAAPAPTAGAAPDAPLLARRAEAGAALYEVHNLIERMERRIVQDTQGALRFSDTARTGLIVTFSLAAAVVVLAAALGTALVRRWVLQRVDALRTATARLAAGEFTHRVPLPAGAERSADELVRLSAEVNHMAAMVKAMQDDRVERERLAAVGEMVRRIAHNLRNPLAGIRGLAELTRSELAAGAPPEDLRENQDRIITSVDRFERWLTDLLTATRPTTLQPETTRVAPWLAGLVQAHAPQAQAKGVDLSLDLAGAPDAAPFDARHLEHAVSAILSNAIEATSEPRLRTPGADPPFVRVAATASGSPEPRWCITITDNGPGVPQDLRERIFQPYFTTKRDGSGIGLAVALQVVKAHRGQLALQSPLTPQPPTPGQKTPGAGRLGARFTISLPLDWPQLAGDGQSELARLGQATVGQPPTAEDGAPRGPDPDHRG